MLDMEDRDCPRAGLREQARDAPEHGLAIVGRLVSREHAALQIDHQQACGHDRTPIVLVVEAGGDFATGAPESKWQATARQCLRLGGIAAIVAPR
jgi:hypothetical protein